MKFRTEIKIDSLPTKIGYENRILALGSCFSEHISQRLNQLKFTIESNPTGILFNPESIAVALEHYAKGERIAKKDLQVAEDVWFHYDFHSDFSALSANEALEKMNFGLKRGEKALAAADRLLITFGTAWVYEREGNVVANCHKQPQRLFQRRRLSVAEIVARYTSLFEGVLRGREVILTVSPVRHVGDGLAENMLSKSILRLAVEELTEKFANVSYFPSYEIMVDDLRDYRFYADDLVHPSAQGVAYVWEQFKAAALSKEALKLIPRVENLIAMCNHRPRNPQSEAHQKLLKKCLMQIEDLKPLDFSTEKRVLEQCLEINL